MTQVKSRVPKSELEADLSRVTDSSRCNTATQYPHSFFSPFTTITFITPSLFVKMDSCSIFSAVFVYPAALLPIISPSSVWSNPILMDCSMFHLTCLCYIVSLTCFLWGFFFIFVYTSEEDPARIKLSFLTFIRFRALLRRSYFHQRRYDYFRTTSNTTHTAIKILMIHLKNISEPL